jgi:hypothetical protein
MHLFLYVCALTLTLTLNLNLTLTLTLTLTLKREITRMVNLRRIEKDKYEALITQKKCG